ncbi:MAG TPA: branched-chain amino acid ABC transporter permease LivH, partial [Alphaproteobacteria bacterium]|nr:branched-chain amino acid ABC transporter permease LivH [Alphaproteobacteria bacterium]
MEYLLQQLINGVTLGAIYGLIALGYTMVYGVLGMINFAHGEIYMIGAFLSLMGFALLGALGLPVAVVILLVLLAAMIITGAWGWSLERLAYRPLRGSPRLVPLISAIGMSIFLQNLVQLLQGARVKTMPPMINGGVEVMQRASDGFTVTISYTQILLWVVTVVLVSIFAYLIQNTSLGRAQRAVSQDAVMAEYLGINSNRTISITFIIAAMLAAVAGCMVMLYYGVVDFYIGFLAGMKAFTAAVLGGIGSLPGALLGGLLIGLIESLWSAYFSIEYKDVVAFI